MATDTERLVIELSANLKNFENNWRRANGLIAKNTKLMEKSFGGVERAAQRAATAIVAAFGVREIANLTDQYTRFTNQLKIAGFEGERLAATQNDIFGIAQKYGVALEDLGTLFGRTSQSANELGASQADLRKFVEGTAAAMRVQGGDVSTARGALIQLSQALGGTTVRAEEFNSMQEGLRPLVIAAANGIDRMGGSFARLRSEVIAGKVSSREFFEGLLKGYDQTIKQAETATLTIGQSFIKLNNALGKYLGETNESLGATHRLAQAIELAANNLDLLGGIIAVVATATASRYTVAMLGAVAATYNEARAATVAAGAVTRLAVAQGVASRSGGAFVALMGGPVSAALTGAVLAVGLLVMRHNQLATASRDTTEAATALSGAVMAYEDAAFAAATASGELRVSALAEAAALRETAKQALAAADAKLALARSTIAALEAENAAAISADRYNARGDRPGTIRPALNAGQLLRAQANATAAATAVADATKRMAAAQRILDSGASARGVGAIAGGAGGAAAQQEIDDSALEQATRKLDVAAEAYKATLLEQAEIQRDLLALTKEQALAEEEKATNAAETLAAEEAAAAEARKDVILKDADYQQAREQAEYDATYNGIRSALQAVADGNALEYLGNRLKQMALDNLAAGITEALRGNSGGVFRAISTIFGAPPVPAYATGTNYHPGGMAMVGERGPELLNIPRGSKVTPNGKLGGMGASVTIVLNNPVVWEGEVAKLRAYVNQVGAMAAATGARQGEASAIARMTKAAHQRLPGR